MPIHNLTVMPMHAHRGVLMHCIYQGHANQARITTWPRNSTDTLYAKDVVTFAQKNGLYPADSKPEDFDFSQVYDPVNVISARLCEARVWDLFRHVAEPGFAAQYLDYAQGKNLKNRMPLFVKAVAPIALNDTMWRMRGHYEGSWFDDRDLMDASPYHSPYRQR